ncbi:exopolyphosphatase/guanosine-5'-triphosphate,3'-diphosphate pyrophosphatase [Kineococcus radiotolerans]|uniref:Exopolyphosphatase/guanosine-5'-triphosphate, 3'-diphosphate pyrophosphatase n=1 Tax=Kineococcus radiotolerans TaxID=131568 RepID=A0A7W4TJW5_KINRA|nr:Ppx/GppA phosphatase family protein [Kineococcus radiotolerans]MBB2900250.1 exopolyphosphatase/guanosine-5'-triphosphate,3'-diphosphate pyrophosphatase [Kineococcus radiotolerans]
MTRRVAAVDCGTNSLRLLVADVDAAAGTSVELERTMEVVRLGQGVDRTGVFAPEALQRTFSALDRAAELVRRHDVEPAAVRFVATSASRDVANRDEFAAGVLSRLGVLPDVVTGEEEAALGFAGATRELGGAGGPFLVVDLGGGSTELVLGERDVESARSLDVGSVRLTERHLHDDPPTPAQVAAARADVEAALAGSDVPLARTRTLVGVAGSITTITAAALDLAQYVPGALHGVRLPVAQVRDACDRLLRATRAERAALPFVHPGRVDVIGAGALVWRAVLERVEAEAGITEVVTSEHDLLDGIAFDLAGNG